MGYVDQNLMPGETVQYRGRLHWIIFLRPVIWLLLALPFFGGELKGLGFLFLFIGIINGIVAFLNLSTSEFAITNKRVIIKHGFIRRVSIELLLTKVEGINVNQGILGRILGYGTIVVSGTGGSKTSAPAIAAPMTFRQHVNAQIEALSTAPAP